MKPRHPARPLLPPARLEVAKSLCRRRQRCDGEHGSCLRCQWGLGAMEGSASPRCRRWSCGLQDSALLSRINSSLGHVNPSYPDSINQHLGQRGCLYGQEILHPGTSAGLGTAASHCALSTEKGSTGVLLLVLGCRDPADPLPAQGKPRQRCPCQPRSCPGSRFPTATLDGVKVGFGVPRDMSGCLLLELVPSVVGAGEQLGHGVSWGWAMRAPALC